MDHSILRKCVNVHAAASCHLPASFASKIRYDQLGMRDFVLPIRTFRAVPLSSFALILALAFSGATLTRAAHAQQPANQPVNRPVDPAAVFQQGQQALASGNLDSAESAFRRVLKIDPQSAAARANLGVVYMRRKSWEPALVQLRKAEQLAPKMSGVRLNIGLVEYNRGNYAEAIAPLASVLRDQADSVQARYLLGLCYSFLDRPGQATTTLEPLWPKMSHQFVYLYVLGISAFHSGNKDLDEKATRRLIEVGGDTPLFHLLMAKALLNHSDDERALAELKKAQTADPNLPFLHFNLGLAYEHLQDHEKAEAEFREGIAVEPDLAYNYEQLARLLLREGKEQEALEKFRAALARDARQPQSHLEVARILIRQGKDKEALTELNAAEKYAPKDHSVRTVRGQLLIRMGRKEEGQAELTEAKKLFSSGLAQEQEKMKERLVPNPELAQQP